jgi:signal transduction histidine kinase/streptogramin lyase
VGSVDGIVAFDDGRIASRAPPIPLRNPPLTAMHADASGTLWAATATELFRVDASGATPVPLKHGHIKDLTDITSDGAGGLWLHDGARGLLHWKQGVLTPAPLPEKFLERPLLASHTDREGRAWFSFAGNHVAVIDRAGSVRLFDEDDGLTVGPYRAIHQDQTGAIWFGGDGGLTRFATGVFTTLPASAATPVHRITGIVDDEDGALWLAVEAAGILRLSRDEIAKALASRTHNARYSAFDKMDGSAGTSRWFGNRAAVRAADGRLWFVAGRGVTVVDPQAVGAERPSDDQVRIEGAVVDGAPLSAASAQELPPGTVRVQIDYTVLDLTAPQKRRFRHRLDGFDSDWMDAGNRHSAFYTNLPPRQYRFRVEATDTDGAYTGSVGEWEFRIRPAFYQTWWFAAACLGFAGLSIGAAWRVHVLRMRKQFSLLLGERARLSREVHDTLLQSMFGYALQFDALAEAVSSSAPQLHQRLARLRHQVEDDIREARQSIWNLRSPMLERQDLPATLKEVGEHAVANTSIDLDVTVSGSPRRASPQVEEQLLRIGREAVSNCVRHAHASRIKISLHYGDDAIVLTVSDDGRGFDAAKQQDESEHFGLTTMRERAESVGGSLHVRSSQGEGTTVTATVPTA